MTSLDHSGTEDLGLAVRLTYGYVLSTTAILSEVETSFVMIAGLIPQDVRCPLLSFLFVASGPLPPPHFPFVCLSEPRNCVHSQVDHQKKQKERKRKRERERE